MLFGIGLVKTVEDFGVQVEYPVYPRLLDYLASEFMSSGWNLSISYVRSSQATLTREALSFHLLKLMSVTQITVFWLVGLDSECLHG